MQTDMQEEFLRIARNNRRQMMRHRLGIVTKTDKYIALLASILFVAALGLSVWCLFFTD